MRNLLSLVVATMLLIGCNDGSGTRVLSESSGVINSLSIVVDNDLWSGSVGNTLRNILGAPVYGLPQDEPMFTMHQMPPIVFTDFATKNRTVVKIEKGKPAGIKFLDNVYARPQKVILVTGNTNQEINDQLELNRDQIVSVLRDVEIREKQRRISISLNKNHNIGEKLGLSIRFPSIYRIAKEEGTFFWIRKDLKTGSMNLMIYELPLGSISEGDEAINDIIRIRDSVGEMHIPGPLEGSYMITEQAYTPYLNETIIDNKPTLETRSTWEIKNAFMAGPFINYMVEDKLNDRIVVLEGFTFAPSINKRNHMFELEAIIRSLKIN